ncbi:MAG: hypothetical protein ACTSWY_16245 [Promethearchaeota archaeon]
MIPNSKIFEERWTTLKQINGRDTSSFRKYRDLRNNQIIPLIKKNQGNVLCILSGVMGTPNPTFLQMTQYPDLNTWQRAQPELNDIKRDFIKEEEVRLFKQITTRPQFPLSIEFKRPFYTNRRFFVKNKDLDEVVKLSENFVWPLYDQWGPDQRGCGILGLFTPIASTDIQEVLLISGYHSITHWEQTRINKTKPEMIDEKIWEQGVKAVLDRAELTLHSTVSFMRSIYLSDDKIN